ncbi:MAG: ribulose-phosphate 3-epimerase [Chloroflexi bacterium]|nr:ribulose-phosphate 3-epimerase [Chloroflexota bacterium]
MRKGSTIVPAVLTDDPKALEAMVRQAESFTDYVQFDIMDGRFVPSHSVTCGQLAAVPKKLKWEAHLMTVRPEEHFDCLREAGARRVVFHFEAAPSPEAVIARARAAGLGVGLAINPETPVPAFLPLAGTVDSVLFLTVHPGFYGAKFLPEVLDKVTQLRAAMPDTEIGVDGGIKEGNVAQMARLGVNTICVGSAVFLQPDPAASFRRLTRLAQEAAPK